METSHFVPDATTFNQEVDDIGQGTHSYLWQHHKTFYLSVIIASSVVSLGILVLEIMYANQLISAASNDPRGLIIFLTFLYPLCVPSAVYAHYRAQMQHIFSQQIAMSLGYSYELTGDTKSLSGLELNPGSGITGNINVTDVIAGTYETAPIRIFTFGRYVSSGKSGHWDHATVFEWTGTTTLPDMLLSPTAFTSGSSTDLAFSKPPAGYKALPFEGDFNKYFTLYIPEGTQVDALQIFQPDVMAELIDKYQTFGLEFVGNKMYVFPRKLITNKADFLVMLGLVEHIHDRVLPTLQEMGGVESATANV